MRWSLLLLGMGLGGCGYSADYVQMNQPPHAMTAKSPEQVQVFSSTAPTQPFVEVGMVSARAGSTLDSDQNEIMRTLRERAAQAGCDALMNVHANNRTAGGQYGGTLIGYEGSCIVFKEAPPAPTAAAAAPAPTAAPAPAATPSGL